MDLKASCAYIDSLASVSIKRVAKETTHIRIQTWLAIQFFLELYDKVWDCTIDINTQTIPTEIGSVKGSPLFHVDENAWYSLMKSVLSPSCSAFVRYPELGQRDV